MTVAVPEDLAQCDTCRGYFPLNRGAALAVQKRRSSWRCDGCRQRVLEKELLYRGGGLVDCDWCDGSFARHELIAGDDDDAYCADCAEQLGIE